MSKLIVIEGVDSSGKATQTKILFDTLKQKGYDVLSVEFPNYKSKSSSLVKMYLNGEYEDIPVFKDFSSKINDVCEKENFLDWVSDFEYNKLNLPKPDLTIFLDMPVPFAKKLMEKRLNKIDNSSTLDIHEKDETYLKHSYDNAHYVADKFGWYKISCVKDNNVRSIEDIANEIFETVIKIL